MFGKDMIYETLETMSDEISELKAKNARLQKAIDEIAWHPECTSFVYHILAANKVNYSKPNNVPLI